MDKYETEGIIIFAILEAILIILDLTFNNKLTDLLITLNLFIWMLIAIIESLRKGKILFMKEVPTHRNTNPFAFWISVGILAAFLIAAFFMIITTIAK